jgi:hypothetical protein
MLNAALVGLMNSLGAEGVAVIGVHSGGDSPFSVFKFGAPADVVGSAARLLAGSGKITQANAHDARPILVATCLTRSDQNLGLALWRARGSCGWDHEDELLIGAAASVIRVVLESPAVQDEIARQASACNHAGSFDRF